MAEIRKDAVTMKGKPLDLVGPKLKAGDQAADFTCVGAGMSVITLKDTAGKPTLFSVVPSLDTPVCNKQTKHFAEALAALGDKVAAYTVSLDLPFAQARFCTEAGITNMTNLSDVHNHSFGEHYGVLIQGLPIPLLCAPSSSLTRTARSLTSNMSPKSLKSRITCPRSRRLSKRPERNPMRRITAEDAEVAEERGSRFSGFKMQECKMQEYCSVASCILAS